MSTVHPIVRQIIDRDCHVSMRGRNVVRHVISKLKNGYEQFRTLSRTDRHRLIADCLKVHRANRELYDAVMTGSRSRRSRRRGGNDELSSTLSGRELTRLMRKHNRTIAGLAFRLGMTQKRVRKAREEGLSNPLAVRDWLQAITGEDPGPIPAKVRIGRITEEASCSFCGCPLYVGDDAYDYVNELFCSTTCCRNSRGWK